MKEKHVSYVVMPFSGNAIRDLELTRTFKRIDAAKRYGLKMVNEYNHCELTTCINGEPVKTDNY